MERDDFDVIIIGSGYGGLLPAWRLTRSGARVLLIERGRRFAPGEFEQSWDPLYLAKVYDYGFSSDLTSTYRVSRVLGGGSVMNSMMHQRLPSEAFAYNDVDTGRPAWPRGVDRAALNPYYDQLENLLGVRHLDWHEVPRIGGNFARMCRDAGLSCDRAHMNLGAGCVRCGFCEAGCRFDNAKLSLTGRTLSEALATGLLTVRENLTASVIRRAYGVYAVDCVKTGSELVGSVPAETFTAPRVIVAAGPLGSVPLLHRSRHALGGKPNDATGAWVCNNGDVNFLLQIPKHYPDHVGYRSTNNAGMISYAFWKEHRVTMHPGFSPVAVMAGIDARLEGKLPWGLEHKHFVKENAINRLIPINAMRQIDPDLVLGIDDKGLARIEVISEKKRAAHGRYMLKLAHRLADTAGGRVMITGIGKNPLDQGGQHILGGARMSDDPRTGVIDADGEVYGHKNLFVTDAAAIPSALGINPALTIGANALRIADRIATRGAS